MAGAAAILWQMDPVSGHVEQVADAALALPGGCNSQEAEAWGARLAMDLCFCGRLPLNNGVQGSEETTWQLSNLARRMVDYAVLTCKAILEPALSAV